MNRARFLQTYENDITSTSVSYVKKSDYESGTMIDEILTTDESDQMVVSSANEISVEIMPFEKAADYIEQYRVVVPMIAEPNILNMELGNAETQPSESNELLANEDNADVHGNDNSLLGAIGIDSVPRDNEINDESNKHIGNDSDSATSSKEIDSEAFEPDYSPTDQIEHNIDDLSGNKRRKTQSDRPPLGQYCFTCQVDYTTRRNFLRHYRENHASKIVNYSFACDCGRSFRRKINLTQHHKESCVLRRSASAAVAVNGIATIVAASEVVTTTLSSFAPASGTVTTVVAGETVVATTSASSVNPVSAIATTVAANGAVVANTISSYSASVSGIATTVAAAGAIVATTLSLSASTDATKPSIITPPIMPTIDSEQLKNALSVVQQLEILQQKYATLDANHSTLKDEHDELRIKFQRMKEENSMLRDILTPPIPKRITSQTPAMYKRLVGKQTPAEADSTSDGFLEDETMDILPSQYLF